MNNTGIKPEVKKVVLILTLILVFVQAVEAQDNQYIFPAEFEQHESIWLRWMLNPEDGLRPAEYTVLEIIRELAPYVKVSLVVDDERQKEDVLKILADNSIPHAHISFFFIPFSNRWMRDMGPVFVKNQSGSLKIVDYSYNFYGELSISNPYVQSIEQVDRIVAGMLNLQTIKSALVSEGGGREFNGKGTLLIVEAVERQRNPDMTRNQINRHLKRTLGQKKVIWLKKGIAEDDKISSGALPGNIFTSTNAGGHIDEFCRFVGQNTILLAEVSQEERDTNPISRISYHRLEENNKILQKAKDQDGNRFEIVRISVPDHIIVEHKTLHDWNWKYTDGSTVKAGDTLKMILSTSYLNFLVTNGAVLAQVYWKEGRPESTRRKDEQSLAILQKVFPDRKIIPIHAEALNYFGGGIHCLTQQQPAATTRQISIR